MPFSRRKEPKLARSAKSPVSRGVQLASLLCGLLGIYSVVLVSSETLASPKATASHQDERLVSQVNRKALPEMVWIPAGTFLMGTNDERAF